MSLQDVHTGSMSASRRTNSAMSVARWRRVRALADDLAVLVAAELVVGIVATIWLVARTDLGRLDIGDGDAAIALALLGGVVPAWLAWLALAAIDGATPGHRRAGLAIEAARARDRLLRIALDPRGLVGWFWLVTLLWLGEAVLVRWLALLAFAVMLGLALTSLVLLLVRPETPPPHDRFARTRLVMR
jgi:hypothetical protein